MGFCPADKRSFSAADFASRRFVQATAHKARLNPKNWLKSLLGLCMIWLNGSRKYIKNKRLYHASNTSTVDSAIKFFFWRIAALIGNK